MHWKGEHSVTKSERACVCGICQRPPHSRLPNFVRYIVYGTMLHIQEEDAQSLWLEVHRVRYYLRSFALLLSELPFSVLALLYLNSDSTPQNCQVLDPEHDSFSHG